MPIQSEPPRSMKLCATETTEEQKEDKRVKFRRRATIEPVIGHLKNDYRMARNYLKELLGDQIDLLMAACAWESEEMDE